MKKGISYPRKVLEPIRKFLRKREEKLVERKKRIKKEDPFTDEARFLNNTASDAKAANSLGHARSAAVRGELDKMLINVRKALTNIKLGKYGTCEVCEEMIDTDRLAINPAVSTCMRCASEQSNK